MYRKLNPTGTLFTRLSADSATRIDKFYVSEELTNFCSNFQVFSSNISDHGILSIKVQLKDSIRRRGYWKANASIFRDNDFKEDFSRIWDQNVEDAEVFDLSWWEDIKQQIIRLIKDHSFRLNYIRRRKLAHMCR